MTLWRGLLMAWLVGMAGLGACAAHADLPVAVAHPGWPQDRSDLPADPHAHFGRLANGLRYVIYRNTAAARATAIRFQIVAGSMQESDRQRGLAHFVEHMAFNGSTNIAEGELTKILAREGFQFGTDVNAFTDYEKTDYVLNLPGNDGEAIETALFILREVAGNLTFAPDAIERERGVVLSEERMRASPGARADQAYIAAAYAGQLYPERNPIGLIETIGTAPRQALVDYYEDFYRPDNAVLVIVGDFDAGDMQRRIEKTFGDWKPARPGPLKAADNGARADASVIASIHADKGLFDSETVTWIRPFITTPDAMKSRIGGMAKYMVTQIMNARFRRLAEDPQSPYLTASLDYDNQHLTLNTTRLTIVPKPGQQRAAFSAALKSLFQFRNLGVQTQEIDDFITRSDAQNANLIRSSQTRFSDDIANELMTDIDEDGVFQSARQYVDLWQAIKPALTRELIDSRARDMLTGDGPVLFRQGDDPAAFDADAMKAAYAEAAATTTDAWAQADSRAWPYTHFGGGRRPVAKSDVTVPDYRHYVFANGVTANIRENPLIRNQIIVSVRFAGGYLLFSPDDKAPLQAMHFYDPTDGGLNGISRDDMVKAMADKSVSIDYALEEDNATLTGYTTADSFSSEMQLLMAYATDAAYSADSFAKLRSSLGYMYAGLEAAPESVMDMTASAFLTSGDPRYVFPGPAAMDRISDADLAALYRRTMTHVPVEITVTGDIKPDQALEQIGKTFANLPAVPATFMTAPGADRLSLPADRTEQVAYHHGRDDQAVSLIVFPASDVLHDLPASRGLSLLAAILTDRLTQDLREKQGATYDVAARLYGSETFKGYGYISIQCTLKPDMDQAFADAVLKVAADIRDQGVTPDELDRARRPLLEGVNDDAKNNEDWQGTIAGLYDHPERLAYVTGVAKQFQAVTADDIQALARTYLRPEAMLRLKAIPAPKS